MKIERFEAIDRCLYWEEKETLIVGDLHLGYEENLNESGISIPKSQLKETLKIFERIFRVMKEKDWKIKEIVLLGDIKHYFSGILRQEFNDFRKIVDLLEKNIKLGGKIVIVKGNHDSILEPITRNYNNIELKDYYNINDVLFLHGHQLETEKLSLEILDKKNKLIIMGHFHPAISLIEGAKTEKYKCFLYGKLNLIKKETIIMPSFFPLIEGSDVLSELEMHLNNFEVYILDEDSNIYDFGKVKKLKKQNN
jgi:hypothetical protein